MRLNTRQDYLTGGATGSVRATDRLMRELQDIYRSQNFKDGTSVLVITVRRFLLDRMSSKPSSNSTVGVCMSGDETMDEAMLTCVC